MTILPSAGISESVSDSDLRLEEKALVERMLAGDEAAMEEFADEYFPGLYRFALSRLGGDTELAREVVQTTVCKALAKLGTFRGEAPLLGWLCACCRNEIRMGFRSKKRQPRVVELEEDIASDRDPPEGALARKEEVRLVHAALDLLPPRYARALEWKYVERVSVKEIAERLRVGAKAAESLLTRSRQAFREGYEQVRLGPKRRLEP
ncbi:MAG TPA: sigma-70 family RNA polymerase sigma factor [Thermoanaerobaculia bacterium]|jgi:RNA polymerase sigma-70 factor (ECF subfamily)|nr:sigma-70 family RNA polymerase sigma factor [Thermoanaerobaculia bacterium]